ncbi:MAG: pyrroline-5-carboxylate reductase [Clostridiales bacterium]|nr:pyrroline-5-carboxylate reductase [Clostridiales bacterium]
MFKEKLGIIGAGNMASAIIKGVLGAGLVEPQHIYIYDTDPQKKIQLIKDTAVLGAENNNDLMQKCSVIIMAVKPDVLDGLLGNIEKDITDQHLLISIAAGVSSDYIREKIGDKCAVIRVMPNAPVTVGEGMSVINKDHTLDEEKEEIVKSIFSSMGRVEEADEKYFDGITAISGSSPAYVYMFIEALADGGVKMGLDKDQAYRLAAQSVLGAAKMVLEQGEHPAVLKDKVCSPGGTTIEAIYTLERRGFRGAIMEAVEDCALKAGRLKQKG